MANVQGLDLVIEISQDSGSTWKYIVCETNSGFTGSRTTTSVATKCNRSTPAVGLGAKEWSMSFSGVVKSDPDAETELGYGDMLGFWDAGTELRARRLNPSETGTIITQEGNVYITDISDSAETDGVLTFDFTLTGNGALVLTSASSS